MDSVVARANISRYRMLLARVQNPEKRAILIALMEDEKRKLTEAIRKGGKQIARPVRDFSQILINGCNVQSVKNSILKLRRGPILHRRGKMIVCEGDPARYLVLVVNGTVRTCRTYKDGTRAIAGFYMPGDVIGWNDEAVHSLSAEAATNSVVLYIRRSALRALAARDRDVADFVLAATTEELRRIQEIAVMSSRPAKSRVATFVYDLWIRLGRPCDLTFPMSYTDVATHLGLTQETFSRTIAELEKDRSIVRLSARRMVLRNRTSLVRLAS